MKIVIDGFGKDQNATLADFAKREVMETTKWSELSKKNLEVLSGSASQKPHISFDNISDEEFHQAQILFRKMERFSGSDGKTVLKNRSLIHKIDSKFGSAKK